MKKKLIKALSFLKVGDYLDLADDTFLTRECDGSDKLYGFSLSEDDGFIVHERAGHYPIDDISQEDLKYIFKLSSVYENIKRQKYSVTSISN